MPRRSSYRRRRPRGPERFQNRRDGRRAGRGRRPPGLIPAPWGGFYPPAPRGGGMLYGLESAGPAPFYPLDAAAYGYDFEFEPRRPPEESPAYGRGGDRELRRWARSHGYRLGPPIAPHEVQSERRRTNRRDRRRPQPRPFGGRRR